VRAKTPNIYDHNNAVFGHHNSQNLNQAFALSAILMCPLEEMAESVIVLVYCHLFYSSFVYCCFVYSVILYDMCSGQGRRNRGARGAIAPKNCTVGLSSVHYVLPSAVCKSFSPPQSHTASSAPGSGIT